MNKLALFWCFFLAIGYTESEVIDGLDVTDLYDKFIIVARGMADNNEYKCSNHLENHRAKILPKVENIIRNLKDTSGIATELIGFAIQLSMIEGFVTDCNIKELVSTVLTITTADGIKKMGQNMIDNASALEGLIQELTAATNQDTRLLVIGKIIRKVTGLTFK